MDQPTCPRCGGAKFVTGRCLSGDDPAFVFAPSQMKRFRFRRGVQLTMGFGACLSCGHVWGSVDPDDLRSYILKYGNQIALQNLGLLDDGAIRGLPNTEAAREVASKLAALDRLVLTGKPTEVPGLFREMMGVTWQ